MSGEKRPSGRKVLVYVALVDLLALAAILSLPRVDLYTKPGTLLLMLAISAVVGYRPIQIQALRTTISASDPFLFATLVALGGLPAVLVGQVSILSSMIGAKLRLGVKKSLFNVAASVVSIATASWVFQILVAEGATLLQKVIPLAAATTAYMLVSTFLISLAISLDNANPFLATWAKTGLWTAVTTYSATTLAVGLLFVLDTGGPALLVLGVPPLWLFVAYFRVHRDRLREQQIRMDQIIESNQRLEEQVRARTAQLAAKVSELERAKNHLRELANTDELTLLSNRRRFLRYLTKELGRSQRFEHAFSVLLMDIDHFKRVNDTYGHPMGDLVLKQLATLIEQGVRNTDLAARYGGEEFAVVLAETPKDGARTMATKLAEQVAAYSFGNGEDDGPGHITISVGVATFPEDAGTAEELIAAADERLYQAKEAGRDRVVA